MITILPEFFLCSSLLILLITGCVLGFSSKYNYPILSYKEFTSLILIWVLLLLRTETTVNITSYFVVDNLSTYSKIFITLALLSCINLESTKKKNI